MPSSKELFKNLKINKDLVVEFFIYFSRLEYALKKAGYIGGDSRKILVDWDKFANDIEKTFDAKKNKELEEAVNYLLSYAPRKQILEGGQLSWKDNQKNNGESEIKYLLRLLRTVRNNLFHGSKFPELFTHERERDEKLLRSSLVILNAFLELKQDLKRNFFEGF